jgi:nucleotide-binding universal stress UspA family protein
MRTPSHRRTGTSVVVVLAAALLLLAAGCGGSSKSNSSAATTSSTPATTSSSGGTVAINDWANGFCSAVYNWGTSMRSVGSALGSNPTKGSLTGAVATVKNANQTLITSLKSLGRPDTEGGAQAKAAVDQLAASLKSHSDQINSAVKSMSGAAELRTAAATLSSNLIAMGNSFRTALSQLKSLSKQAKGNFRQAFQQSSACKKLQSQSSG